MIEPTTSKHIISHLVLRDKGDNVKEEDNYVEIRIEIDHRLKKFSLIPMEGCPKSPGTNGQCFEFEDRSDLKKTLTIAKMMVEALEFVESEFDRVGKDVKQKSKQK